MLQHIAEEILKLFELMDPLLSCVQSTDIFITSIHHLYCSVSDLQHFLFFNFILFLNLKHCISFAKHQNESATAFPFDCLYKCYLSAHMTHLFLHVVYFLPSRSGSGTRVVLRGADSVGPAFCVLPRSSSSGDEVLGGRQCCDLSPPRHSVRALFPFPSFFQPQPSTDSCCDRPSPLWTTGLLHSPCPF